MDKNPIINILLAFCLILIGLMFIEGVWRNNSRIINVKLNPDDIFFPNIKDKRILKLGDQLAFLISLIMSVLTFINGMLFLISDKIPNVSAIFVFIAVILTWPIRIIFIYSKKNSRYEDLSRIWPFPK